MFLLQKTEQLVDAEIIYNNSLDVSRSLQNGCFTKCNKLRNIILPEGIRRIPELAFAECKNLLRAKLPTSLENIERRAFKACNNLKEISMPNVRSIGESAFKGCKKLLERDKEIDYVGRWVICCNKKYVSQGDKTLHF